MTSTLSKILDNLGWISSQETDQLIIEILDYFSNKSGNKFLIACAVWETMNPNTNVEKLVTELKLNGIKTILFFESTQRGDSWIESLYNYCEEIVFVDFFAYRCYQELVIKKTSLCNDKWNPKATKFLYLTGTARFNRLRMFYKLYSANLLDKTTWSLFLPEDPTLLDPKWIPEIHNTAVFDFFKPYETSPDNMPSMVHFDGSKVVGEALRYDYMMYQNSLFRLIAETDAEMFRRRPSAARLTEKTWTTIANRLPFLILGQTSSLKSLKTQNIKTFEQYTKIPEYDRIKDIEDRMDAITENVAYWLQGMPVDSINADVEHNYQQFIDIGQNIQQQLENLVHKHNLNISFDELLPTVHNLDP